MAYIADWATMLLFGHLQY